MRWMGEGECVGRVSSAVSMCGDMEHAGVCCILAVYGDTWVIQGQGELGICEVGGG